MRNLLVSLTLALFAVVPQAAWADGPTPPQSREPVAHASLTTQLPELLKKLDVSLISKAQAAECTAEGETCTSDEQCCPGLQCVGGPPTTCSLEE